MTGDTFRYANAVVSNKSVYMRDADKYEEELATPITDPANADTQTDGTPTLKETPVQHDWEKRHNDLKSYYDRQLNQAAEALKNKAQENLALEQKLLEKPKTYPVSEAEIAEWAAQFPDFYKTLITVVERKNDQTAEQLRKEMARLEDTSKAIAAEKGRAELLKLHPDANDIEKDPRFAVWFAEQPSEVRVLIESSNPKAIAKGLNLYKEDMGIKTVQKNNTEKEASQAITLTSKAETPRDKKVWKESEIDKMHPRTFAKFEKEIDAARAEGRFEYDLSSM